MIAKASTAAYLTPIIVFGVFGAVEPYVSPSAYPIVYFVKITAVILSLAIIAPLDDLWPLRPHALSSILVGLVVFVLWVGIDSTVPYPHLGSRVGFDPMVLPSGVARTAFLAVRLCGLILVVPVMEELCWRSFVLRYVTNDDFRSVPIGTFSLAAFGVMIALSAAAHPEWVVAAIASAIYGLWVRYTKSLFAVVVAHAVTNAALGAYVLVTHNWQYW